MSDRALMPPPHSNRHSFSGSYNQARLSNRNQKNYTAPPLSTSSNTTYRSSTPSRNWNSNTRPDNSSNLSSNSDAHKPRRKRRPKKKKQVSLKLDQLKFVDVQILRS